MNSLTLIKKRDIGKQLAPETWGIEEKKGTEEACNYNLLEEESYQLLLRLISVPYYQMERYGTIKGMSAQEIADELIRDYGTTCYHFCPFIDISYFEKKVLANSDENNLENILHLIMRGGCDNNFWQYFDAEFYVACNPDVACSGMPPFLHYVLHGCHEGRYPSLFVKEILDPLLRDLESKDLHILFENVPQCFQDGFLNESTLISLNELYHPRVFSASICDSSENISFGEYLVHRNTMDTRESACFHAEYYLYQISKISVERMQDIVNSTGLSLTVLENAARSNPILHWILIGKSLEIVPSPILDTEIYISENRDLAKKSKIDLFHHFSSSGIYEKSRIFSNFFNARYYWSKVSSPYNRSAWIDYLVDGQFNGVLPIVDLNLDHFPCKPSILSSVAEQLALKFIYKNDELEIGIFADVISRAKLLEPQIVRPYGRRRVRMAPILHPEVPLFKVVSKLQSSVETFDTTIDTIVLIPHCRMAGSARIAGEFSNSLNHLHASSKTLVISTDASHFERPDWFPDEVKFLDFSAEVNDLDSGKQTVALLDLIRGIQPKRVVNINSRIGWMLTQTYGKQLSHWLEIYAYLFCWDLDARGNKGGYPIQWFLPSFNYLRTVFTDSIELKSEIQNRYSLSGVMKDKLVALYTPIQVPELNCSNSLRYNRDCHGRMKCFWSGRFDRQKRFDLVLDLAKLEPDLDIYVWGKSVLGDYEIPTSEIPENVKMMGTYKHIEDIPLEGFDFFLYTSEWDGLPTVLIEVGARGIPVVASNVGGVSELIDESTGWIVDNFLDAQSYKQVVSNMYDSGEMKDRAKALRKKTLSLCSHENYTRNILSAMEVFGV